MPSESCCATTGAIEWRQWGDEFVVYDAERACTHLLDELAGSALLALRASQRPLTIDELLAQLLGEPVAPLDRIDTPERALELSSLQSIVRELERLGFATLKTP